MSSVAQSSLFTDRLELRPLSLPTVIALLESRPRGEIEGIVGAQMPWAWPSRALVDQAFPASLEAVRADPETRLWGDRLILTRGSAPRVVGSVIFHGKPPEDGVAEVAYAIEDGSQGLGYATEAVPACLAWALAQPECRLVRATTTAWHVASKRLLEKVGMRVVGERRADDVDMVVYELAASA